MASIIAIIDPTNLPVAFLLDTLDDKGNIQMWNPTTDEIVATNLSFYKTTKSASDLQELDIANRYVAKFGLGSDFTLRRKLFRASKIANLHNGQHAEAIVTQGVASPAKPPEESLQVQTKQGKIIPADEFVEKIIAALTAALRDTL